MPDFKFFRFTRPRFMLSLFDPPVVWSAFCYFKYQTQVKIEYKMYSICTEVVKTKCRLVSNEHKYLLCHSITVCNSYSHSITVCNRYSHSITVYNRRNIKEDRILRFTNVM